MPTKTMPHTDNTSKTLPSSLRKSALALSVVLLEKLYQQAIEKTDSPIEALFFTAFTFLIRNVEAEDGFPISIFFEPQVEIDKYIVDFCITYKGAEIVVECDGHDFHERTKEQAAKDRARDRRLQSLDYTVLRFTGSELYRDAMKCAWEVYVELNKLRKREDERDRLHNLKRKQERAMQ